MRAATRSTSCATTPPVARANNFLTSAEFLIAGATAVEVGTALFWDPRAALRIAAELGGFLRREKVASVSQLVGTIQL